MDLLFSRYASPYIFLGDVLEMNRLHDFVVSTVEADNEKKLWSIYIALVSNPYAEVTSFDEFKRKHSAHASMDDSSVDLEETVKESYDTLQNFHPGRKVGGET